MDPSAQFGANVRTRRRALGLSQEALAGIAKVHTSEVSRLERAERDPRLSTIMRVAAALEVPPATLLEGVVKAE